MDTSWLSGLRWVADFQVTEVRVVQFPLVVQVTIWCGIFLIAETIVAIMCWFLSTCPKAIPPEHRRQQPNRVWLLLIPLFYFVWIFFVLPPIADSYRSYFTAIGRTDVGDCGRGLALAYCIAACCMVVVQCIPCLGIPGWAAVLVLLIMVLVKFGTLKGQIQQVPPSDPPVVPTV